MAVIQIAVTMTSMLLLNMLMNTKVSIVTYNTITTYMFIHSYEQIGKVFFSCISSIQQGNEQEE